MLRAAPRLFKLSSSHWKPSGKNVPMLTIHSSTVGFSKKKGGGLSAEDQVLYFDDQNKKTEMSVAHLIELADKTEGRSIYKVDSGSKLPAFKLMNARELEIAVSKARRLSTGQTFHRIDPLTMQEDRVKEKNYRFKTTSHKNQASRAIKGPTMRSVTSTTFIASVVRKSRPCSSSCA